MCSPSNHSRSPVNRPYGEQSYTKPGAQNGAMMADHDSHSNASVCALMMSSICRTVAFAAGSAKYCGGVSRVMGRRR